MDDYTFQLGDGEILNADFVPGASFVDVQKVSGLDSAPFRFNERNREGGDGGFLDSGYKDMRTVVIEGVVYGDEAYLETLKGDWRPYREGLDGTGGGMQFKYGADGLDRMVIGRSLGMRYDWAELRRTGRCEVQFQLKCEDPSIYGLDQRSFGPLVLGSTTQLGYDYPRDYPRTYGGSGQTQGSGTVGVFNAGTAISYPDITITGPAVNPFITNDSWPSLGQPRLQFNVSLDAADSLMISMKHRTVMLNGIANRRIWLAPTSIWWGLMPGINFVAFGADTATAATATGTYYDAYE